MADKKPSIETVAPIRFLSTKEIFEAHEPIEGPSFPGRTEFEKETPTRPPLGVAVRFALLERDSFTCAYCGARPGNDQLHIDHLLPWCLGGTDDPANLITACARCNLGKGRRIYVPSSLCEAAVDHEGFRVWKRFGDGSWYLAWGPTSNTMFLSCRRGYWIPLDRVHEHDWFWHVSLKTWMTTELRASLSEGLAFCRAIVRPGFCQPESPR